MRRSVWTWAAMGMSLGLALALAPASARQAPAADAGLESWEKLKSLAGNWEGRYSDGTGATVSYRLVSDGTAVIETLESSDSSQMITVYHRDGSTLLMTHYCSLGNQTRMRSRGLTDGRLVFTYVDASNVKGPDDHVMSGLVLTFAGPDRLVHEWTSKHAGKEQTGRFEFMKRNP